MQLSENKTNEILDILGSYKRDSLLSKEICTFEDLWDTAISLELIDLEKAITLMELALLRRLNAPWPKKKLNLYNKMLTAKSKGIVTIKGVTLSIDHHISLLILRSLVTEGYENQELTIAIDNITPDDIVLELGAGIGFMANSISSLCKRYISYEANPYLIPLIENSKSINNSNFEINHGVVLDDDDDEVPFYITPDFWAGSLVKPKTTCKEITVKSFNKNRIIANIKPTVLIVDIEGGEYAFFKKLDCRSIKKIIIEIHPNVLSSNKLTDLYSYFIENKFILDFQNSSKNVLYWYR